jgi:hypothetical protein
MSSSFLLLVGVTACGAGLACEETEGLLVCLADEIRRSGEVTQPDLGAHGWDLDDLDPRPSEQIGGVAPDAL